MRTIDKIITKVDTSRGAPLGRFSKGTKPVDGTKIFDRKVPMDSSREYDTGGVYWGYSSIPLRVSYTKDLSYINFYRAYEREV